jgi:hypothetical protein
VAPATAPTVNVQLFTCLNSTITGNPAETPSIANSYVGVGFQQNVVGYLDAQINGHPYTNLEAVKGLAQINWGDKHSSAGSLVDMGTDPSNSSYEEYLIKGSHIYQQSNPLNGWSISVNAHTPDGTSLSGLTATAFTSPMPGQSPGKPPKAISKPAHPEDVNVQMFTCLNSTITGNPAETPSIANSYVGVGFHQNVVGYVDVQLNGNPFTKLTAVKNAAQINWGDSSSWSKGTLVDMGLDPSNSSYEEYAVKGSHVYQKASPLNGFAITVYVQGPDGTSLSGLTATAFVSPMPGQSPGKPPTPISKPAHPEDVNVQLFTCLNSTITGNPAETPSIANSYVGVGFQNNVVGYLDVQVNGNPYRGLTAVNGAAQINWGDSSSWYAGALVDMGLDPSNSSYEVYAIKGSHVYQKVSPANGFPITVYVQGPDGTSLSGLTATAFVKP